MTNETMEEALEEGNEGYLQFKRTKAIEKLAQRTERLTLGQIAKIVNHPEHGSSIENITLQEIIDVKYAGEEASEQEKPTKTAKTVKATKATKRAKMEDTENTENTENTVTTTTKKTNKKSAVKAVKPVDGTGRKADFGKKKPRLQRDQGYKEVLAALKTNGGPMGRGALEESTGYTAVQVRTFCKELAAQGKIKIEGNGGRSTKYTLP